MKEQPLRENQQLIHYIMLMEYGFQIQENKKGYIKMMKQLLKIELERAFRNKKFLAVVILETALIIYDFIIYALKTYRVTIPFLLKYVDTGKVDSLPGVYSTWIGLHYGQTRTIIFSVLPLLCAFVYGSSLYLDEKFHYNNQLITRTSKKSYYLSKLIVMFISGGVVAVYPFILSLIMNSTILPFEEVLVSRSYFMGDMAIFTGVFYKASLLYVFIYLLWIFISFGLLNCICLFATYIFANGFVVMASPFCVYFCTFVISNFISGYIAPWSFVRMNERCKGNSNSFNYHTVYYIYLITYFINGI